MGRFFYGDFGVLLVVGREPGELDQDPIAALGLNHRFGHAELVDAFAQDLDGLAQFPAGVRRVGQAGGVHLDQERGAALQIQAQANSTGGTALEAVENVAGGILFVLGFEHGEIPGDIVRADGLDEVIVRFLGHGLFKRLRPGHDVREDRVARVDGVFTEVLDQVLALGRVQFVKGPEDDQEDQDKAPNIISIHDKLRFTRGTAALRDLGDGRLGDFKFRISRSDREGFFLHGDHCGHHAAGGYNFITRLDGFEQLSVIFCFFGLGADQHEVKHHDHDDQHAHGIERLPAGIGLRAGSGRLGHRQERARIQQIHNYK